LARRFFHLVGFDTDGKTAFRKKIRRLGFADAFETGEAFERGRDFGAWLGLVPRQYSTGGRSVLGRISKRGSKYLRTLLIQATFAVAANRAKTTEICRSLDRA
jgi:transposase